MYINHVERPPAKKEMDEEVGTLVGVFSTNENLERVVDLVRKGANVNTPGTMGQTALISSARSKELQLMEFFIKAGADLNYQDDLGYTALYRCIDNNDASGVSLLIENGADIYFKDRIGGTALERALRLKNVHLNNPIVIQILEDFISRHEGDASNGRAEAIENSFGLRR